jgi:cobalt-zinc-cadmium efflux system outer membrane protein
MRATTHLLLGLATAACTSLDPAADRTEVHDALGQRLGLDAPAASVDDGPAIDDEVRALLREPLTAASAVRLALLHNHRVRATYARLGIARADLVQAGLLRNPAFDLDVRFLESGGTDMEFGLSQPVLELFFRPLRNQLAAHRFAAAKLRVTDELIDLVFAVRRAVVQAQAAEQLVALHRRALAAAAAAHTLQLELHAAGNATDQALAIERLGETKARLDLAAAEQDAQLAREPLQALLGLHGAATEWTLAAELAPDPLADFDLTEVESRVVAASLDLAAHREGLNALAQQTGLDSWRGWFPELVLGPNGIRVPGGTFGFGPRLEGELPLFDTGATRRARSTAELQAGMHDHVQLAVELRAAARSHRDRASHLAARVRFLREVHLPQREAVVKATIQNYNAMQIGAFEVLAQQQQQLADERAAVETLRLLHMARLDLEQLLAGSNPDRMRDERSEAPR